MWHNWEQNLRRTQSNHDPTLSLSMVQPGVLTQILQWLFSPLSALWSQKKTFAVKLCQKLAAPFSQGWGSTWRVLHAPEAAATAKIFSTSLKAMTTWCCSVGKQDMPDFPQQLSQYNPNKFIFSAYSVVFYKDAFQNILYDFPFPTVSLGAHHQPHNPAPAQPHCSFPLLKIEMFFNLTIQPLQKLHISLAAWHTINFLFLIFQDSLKIPSMSFWGSPDETENLTVQVPRWGFI